jgi:large subunit ribosomal protein L10
MARADKATAVAELADGFRNSSAVVLTEYRGLTVAQLKELRRTLGQTVRYAVVKNTLTKIAAKQADVEGLDHLLVGPSAIAFVSGDPVEAAKGLRDFARANPSLVIKGGVMDGLPLAPDEIRKLADLESREVLLAKLAGALKASLSGAVSLFAAPLSQTARLLEALRQKAEADPSILAAAEPEPEPVAQAEPVESAAEAPDSIQAAPDATEPTQESAETEPTDSVDAQTAAVETPPDDAQPAEEPSEAGSAQPTIGEN